MNPRSLLLAAVLIALLMGIVAFLLLQRGGGTPPDARKEAPPASVAPPANPDTESSRSPDAGPVAGPAESPDQEEKDEPAPETAAETAKTPPKDKGREWLMASADVNGDERPDLVVYERAEEKIVQVLLATEDEEFEDGDPEKVPPYLARFLALAAEKGPTEGPVLLRDEAGDEHEVLLWGEEER